MLKAVEVTSNITYSNSKINDIIDAKDAILQAIVQQTQITRPESLVNAIFTQPFTKVKHLVDASLYAENTGRKYLDELSTMGGEADNWKGYLLPESGIVSNTF